MARELRRPKTGYDVLRRRFAEGKGPVPPDEPVAVPAAVAEAATETALAVSSEPDPVAASEDLSTAEEPPLPDDGAAVAVEPTPKRARRERERPVVQPAVSPRDGRASIKFNLSAPAPGVFSLYDQAAAAMGHRKALPALIAKAFEALEAELAAGEPLAHMDYPIGTAAHRTSSSRMMDADLLGKAREALDPFGLLTPTAFGSLLAATALARLLHRRSASIKLIGSASD